MRKTLLAIFAFFGSWVLGTEIVWTHLETNFTYRDIWRICDTNVFPGRVYLAAEVEQNQTEWVAKKAALRTSKSDTPYLSGPNIILENAELSGISYERDGEGRFTLKTLPLSRRLLNWVFFNHSTGYFGCLPPKPLKTIDPDGQSYVFETSEAGISSQLGTFRGARNDGYAYIIELQFHQK